MPWDIRTSPLSFDFCLWIALTEKTKIYDYLPGWIMEPNKREVLKFSISGNRETSEFPADNSDGR